MRKLLMAVLILGLTNLLVAQPTPRAGQSSLVPTSAKTRKSLNPEQNALKSKSENDVVRPAQQAQSATARQAAQTTPAGTTAKSVGKIGKSVAPIKLQSVKIEWLTLEEALEKSKTEKRKILVDVYTDWCGWCKHMDSTTFTNPAVVRYLNENYYAVKFNAEQQQDVTFKDKTYHFKRNGPRGHHELAAEWLNNNLSYPTTVFLDESQSVIQPLKGFLDASKMEAIINYFGTDSHKKTPWEAYEKKFNSAREK
jgi:thioredoxin-related protein